MGGGERHSSMLAQVLADEGHEVDLVGHRDVGKDLLADHLGLNLGKVNLRIVPERGEPQVARLSAEYELFINASYMSRVKAQARRNLYLCYFPTPFDPTWRAGSGAVRRPGRPCPRGQAGVVEWGLGWFPPEGGGADLGLDQRQGRPPAGRRAGQGVVFDLGRPGGPARPRWWSDRGGAELARSGGLAAGFRRHELELPPPARPRGRLRQRQLCHRGRRRPHPRGR